MRGTGIKDVHVRSVHLRLPGWGDDGPTLEIFQYNRQPESDSRSVNSPGFGHIAFSVGDVRNIADRVLNTGGSLLGEIVTTEIQDVGPITWAYMRDPEGNIIELQHRGRAG
jgi:catechol 2,3-dioxygenase-like lactoylglutathione lyase family enzyme